MFYQSFRIRLGVLGLYVDLWELLPRWCMFVMSCSGDVSCSRNRKGIVYFTRTGVPSTVPGA